MLKRSELSCKQAVSEAIRFRKNQIKSAKISTKEALLNEIKYLEYHKSKFVNQ